MGRGLTSPHLSYGLIRRLHLLIGDEGTAGVRKAGSVEVHGPNVPTQHPPGMLILTFWVGPWRGR